MKKGEYWCNGFITSYEDKKATKRLEMVGQILGIPVVDHIIVGENKENYYSFHANDILNPDEEK